MPPGGDNSSNNAAAGIATHPAVEIPKGVEALLPNAFCAFEISLSEKELVAHLSSTPLLVRVLHQDEASQQKKEVGSFNISLISLLKAPEHSRSRAAAAVGDQQQQQLLLPSLRVVDTLCPITSSSATAVGTVRVVLTLEDFGLTDPQRSLSADANSDTIAKAMNELAVSRMKTEEAKRRLEDDTASKAALANRREQIEAERRMAIEYQAAWELEMWKRAEQAKWHARLQEREAQRMQQLEEEWKKQEIQREQIYARRQKDVGKLEKKLKEALFDVEKQEKRLKLSEEEVEKRAANVERDAEEHKREAFLSVTRLKDQQKHQMNMAKMAYDSLKKDYDVISSKLKVSEKKQDELSEEVKALHAKNDKSQVGLVREQLREKEIAVKHMERQLEESIEKEKKSKAQMIRVLQELARVRKQREDEAAERLQMERYDVQRLRAQLLAKQQSVGVRRDAEELQNIKRQLHVLLTADPLGNIAFPEDDGNYPTASAAASTSTHPGPEDNGATSTAKATSRAAIGLPASEHELIASLRNPALQKDLEAIANGGGEDTHHTNTTSTAAAQGKDTPRTELKRLQNEKRELLSGNVYSHEHPIIVELTKRITLLQDHLQVQR